MKQFEIGIRKYVEDNYPEYWLAINAKITKTKDDLEEEDGFKLEKLKRSPRKSSKFPIFYSDSPYWKIFILCTILINTLITINFYPQITKIYLEIIILVHLACFFYWIDVIGTIVSTIYRRKKIYNFSEVFYCLTLDLISLLPLSIFYIIFEPNFNTSTFWLLRSITLIRFYRIPLFISILQTAEENHWKIQVASYVFYLILLNDIFVNIFLYEIKDPDIHIYDWQDSALNKVVTALYFVITTTLNIGFGDLSPLLPIDVIITTLSMLSGFILITGVLTASIATEIANKEKRRENCRLEYEDIISALKNHKIDKNVIDKTSNNFKALWKYKKGYSGSPAVHLLPLSLRKEIFYDINIGLLSRSLIFAPQPKSFLRSLSLFVKNYTFLPGDIVIQPYGLVEGCVMISSGIIEILSEENDETPLFSFTYGTVLGEVALFTSIPIRCIIKASTLTSIQILPKINFLRLASKYPKIYRSMRSQISDRLNVVKSLDLKEPFQALDENVQEMSRKKTAKRLLKKLRTILKEDRKINPLKVQTNNILNLYVIAEYIPKVKTSPLSLIKGKPWILRPNTVVTDVWNLIIVVLAGFVAYFYPYFTAFVRVLSNETYMVLKSIQLIFILDIFVRIFTAIKKKHTFTYVTSIKEILKYNVKKPGFYFDVLAAFDLTVYAVLLNPNNPDYAMLLLSLNKLLKVYRIPKYFRKLENNLGINLFLIRSIKYVIYFTITLFWVAALLYMEACPENCIEDRWFEDTEIKESLNPTPCSAWPAIISTYWAGIIVAQVGYGDLKASAVMDCAIVIISIIGGVIIVTYCTAQGSSTAKYINNKKTVFQEQVFAVDRFMKDHNIQPELQQKVRNYFRVQWDYDEGFEMKYNNALLKETFFPQPEIMIPQIVKKFSTVPLFQDTSSEFILALAKFSKIRILPPNEVLIYIGSFIKEMYIIENGYCEISNSDNQRFLMGPGKPFGSLEMILGMRIDVNMRTITHVRIICLDYQSYLNSVTLYPVMKTEIEARVRRLKRQKNADEILKIAFLAETIPFVKTKNLQFLSRTFINVYKYHKNMNTSYWAPFQSWRNFKLLRFLFLPFIITPQCIFLKILVTLRIIKVILIGLIAPVYFSLPHQFPELSIIILVLLIFTWIDMYLMFYVAYYNEKGLLVFHPAKTTTWYLKNNFLLDLITAFPFHLLLNTMLPRKENKPSLMHDSTGFIMILQYYKFYQAFHYIESDILRILQHIKMLKYIPLSVILTNTITGFLILLECNEAIDEPFHTYGSNNLEFEYHKSITAFCFPPNNSTLAEENLYPLKFYFITYYWVTSTMTQCGFGDISAHNRTTMIAVILLICLGLFLYGYMFASLTGGMITAYNSIAKYRRNVKEMLKFTKENGANPKVRKRLRLFYEFLWLRTEGATPQTTLNYIHEALRLNIIGSIYETTINRVPAFKDAEKSVLAVVARCLEEVYFLRGETIVKFNDIQEYIYVVHQGKVDLYSEAGVFITSMEKGGIFGNITKKTFSRSSIVVVSSKNVDALRLNTELFFQTLQIFPNTKKVIEFLKALKKDYIEPIDQKVGNISPSITLDEDKDILPYEVTLINVVRPSVFGGIDIYTINNKYLYLKSSIYKPPWMKPYKFIILHNSWLNIWLGRFFSFLSVLNFFLGSYMFIFEILDYYTWILVYALDFFFYIKIWLQFHYSFFDSTGNYVVNFKAIRRQYKKDKALIFCDIFSNIPLDFFALLGGQNKKLKTLTLVRLNRCYRFYYAYHFYHRRKKYLMVNKIFVELLWIVTFFIVMVHFFACIWIFLTRPLGKKAPTSWVTEMYMNKDEHWKLFIFSVYYIVGILTTTGFGDVKVIAGSEVAAAIFFMLACRFAVGMMAGSVAAVINVHGQTLFLYQERINELKEYFVLNSISKYQLTKMWRYVTSLWLKESGRQIPKFIKSAPHVIKCDIMTSMFGEHLSQSYAFSNTNEAFLRHLSIYLKRAVYFPGNYIAHQGEIDHTMYFINSGQVSVLTIHANLMETIHYKLVEKDNFGLTQGLIKGKAHHFTYRAESETDILSLSLDEWKHLLKYFPEEEPKIYERLKHLPIQKELFFEAFTSSS